jgi:hypothetical protein
MKAASILVAGLAVATLLIAPATAGPPANAVVTSFPSANGPWVGCSLSAGWNFSSTCRNTGNFKSYVECTTAGTKVGHGPLQKWWYCSSLGFKN